MPVITLWQIVAILYSILHSTGNQCKSIRGGWEVGDVFEPGSLADKTSSTARHTLNFVYKF